MRRKVLEITLSTAAFFASLTATIAGSCPHGWDYEEEWVYNVNITGTGTGIKITSDTTCLERYSSGQAVYTGELSGDSWYAEAQWLADSTTSCNGPLAYGMSSRYEMSQAGDFLQSGLVNCKYCDCDDE